MTAEPKADPTPGRWRGVRVVWNASAGAKGGISTNSAAEEQIRALMATSGLGDELCRSGSPDEARALTAAAVRDGYDLVVAAGGDGTIGLVADELLDQQTALGILPLGSVMNVPRSLGLPRELDAAAEVLRTGQVRAVDVGEARGRPFYEAGSVGLNAAMFREADRVDAGDWTALARTIWVAFRYRPARMEIALDDRTLRTRALMVTVANGPYTGIALTVAPEARLDDGLFDVVLFRRFSKLQLLRHLAGIAFGRRRYTPEFEVHRSSRVRVDTHHARPCRADSHDLGVTPIEFVVRPGALRVVVQRDTAAAAIDGVAMA